MVRDAIARMTEWQRWIPVNQKPRLEDRVKDLRRLSNDLEARRAEFLTAQRIAEEERREREPQLQPTPQPVVRIKPTSLPKFSGVKRNFHQW